MKVLVQSCRRYDEADVRSALHHLRPLFEQAIRPGDRVVLKPNWLAQSHKHRRDEWRSVITNPEVITGVLQIVLECLGSSGEVVITDAPQTDSSFSCIMARMDPTRWAAMGQRHHVPVTVLDLRDHQWTTRGDVNVGRMSLPGDPLGSTCTDLGPHSEFVGHRPSSRGYYGADYNIAETNEVHHGEVHKYTVSRAVISADVFVNLPKMKTHKKAGITCSLKNLVGINTYKNWLPHYNEGTPAEGGDQFPRNSATQRVEGVATDRFKSLVWTHPTLGKWLIPVKYLGRKVFGETSNTVRSGNWYGNDTLWRMVLDLNKVLLYSNPDGTLRTDDTSSRKKYITVVDGVIAGEGNGPEAPEPKQRGLIVGGTDAVAVDAVCAKLMGFDWQRIPCIRRAFDIASYRLCDFRYEDIRVVSEQPHLNGDLIDLSTGAIPFRPHFGWTGHIELPAAEASLRDCV